MGNAKGAAEERRLRRKGDTAKVRAPRRRPSSWRRRKRQPWESAWDCSATKEASSFKPVPGQASSVSRCAGGGHSFFLSLHSSDTRRTCVLWVSRATPFVWSLQVGAVLGVLRERLEPIKLSVDPATEVASVGDCVIPLWGFANRFPNFLSVPPDSVLLPRFWNISCGFFLHHRKEFQLFRCLQSSRILGMSSEKSTRLFVACGAGLLVDGRKHSWMCARRAARGVCVSSTARGSSVTCSPKSSGNGTSTSLRMRWRWAVP